MANHPKRGRGAEGYVPTPDEIKTVRGELTQTDAGRLIYVNQVRWSNYESGLHRMHPAVWELFKIKRGGEHGTINRGAT